MRVWAACRCRCEIASATDIMYRRFLSTSLTVPHPQNVLASTHRYLYEATVRQCAADSGMYCLHTAETNKTCVSLR